MFRAIWEVKHNKYRTFKARRSNKLTFEGWMSRDKMPGLSGPLSGWLEICVYLSSASTSARVRGTWERIEKTIALFYHKMKLIAKLKLNSIVPAT